MKYFFPIKTMPEEHLVPLPLMKMIKEASAALKKKIESAGKPEKFSDVFSTEQDMKDFFFPFFKRQNETTDEMFFINLVVLDNKYHFIAGGLF